MRNQLLRAGDLVEIRNAKVIYTIDEDGLMWHLANAACTLAVVIDPDEDPIDDVATIFVASVCEIAHCDHEFLRAIT